MTLQHHQIVRLPRNMILMIVHFTYETLFTMRGATGAILQRHQTLRLPRKKTLTLDPRHTGKVIYSARSHRCHPPTSPNTAPATQNDFLKFDRNFSKTDETSFTMRDRSDHDPRMKPSVRNPPRNRGSFSCSPLAFSIEKYNSSRSGYHSKFHQMLHLPRKVTLELHQTVRLPRKVTLELHQI